MDSQVLPIQQESQFAFSEWLRKLSKQMTIRLPMFAAGELHSSIFRHASREPEKNPPTDFNNRLPQVETQGQPVGKILVFGAGVLGSLYAGKLAQAGHDVTMLARGQRLTELRQQGLILVSDGSSKQKRIPVKVIDHLGKDDAFDLVMVVVRKNQISSALPVLAENRCTPNVLFLVNNAEGPEALVEALGPDRVILGFPGAGGQRVDGVVHYQLATTIQPTTIGEFDGQKTKRIVRFRRILEDAGLPTTISAHMDAWLKTHVAVVSPVANALYLAGGNNYRLANTRDGLVLLVRAVKEGLQVLNTLHIPVTPAKYRALAWLPEPLLVAVLRKSLATPWAELVLARHANAARDEMQALADEFRALAHQSGRHTPAIDALYSYLDPQQPPAPEGQASLRLIWGPVIAAIGGILSSMMLVGWLLIKRSAAKK